MDWGLRRKLVYALAVTVALSALAVFLLRDTLFPAPTCVDQKKNGYEFGVDCGGTCALKCTQEVNPLVVVWAKVIPSGPGIYDIVAMINNSNIDNASQEIGFSFTLYDEQGTTTATFFGSTTAPLAGKFPVIIQNVPLEKAPKEVVASLSDGPHYTVKESPSSPTVRIVNRRYEQDSISRVYATARNTKQVEINNLPVRVVLFDTKDNAYAVGQTIVPRIAKEGVAEIVFTWNNVLSAPPARIEVYPIFDPFKAIGY